MVIAHNLGFPRIGLNRDLKWALERYWKNEIDQTDLENEGRQIRLKNWALQIQARHDFLSVGDFSWYDHVLDLSTLLGVIPLRFLAKNTEYDLDTYFRMARGRAPKGMDVLACEMTKWFDTNYHYIVPEFHAEQEFKITNNKLFIEIVEAQAFNKKIKPILLGPLSYLWLGKVKKHGFDKLNLIKKLQKAYIEILIKFRELGIEWVQIDEPILVLDLPKSWRLAFQETYESLQIDKLNLLLTTYFGDLDDNAKLACNLPTAGLHIDVVRGEKQLACIADTLPNNKVLSIGTVVKVFTFLNCWRIFL